jgi:pimeloyl-ACP methyl ester carboxylesterase
MPRVRVRDTSLWVEVVGHGYPLLLMHGGPGADLWTLQSFRRLADRHTLVFYDHRCNGRSVGPPVRSMTWDNLTADADALREALGYERWAVLGHSFGGKVALEYALRYPDRLSHLVLMDTGADSFWDTENAAQVLAERGFSPATVRLAERFFRGRIAPRAYLLSLMRLGGAYDPHTSLLSALRTMAGAWRSRPRSAPFIFGFRHLMPGWSVMDRLGEIHVPTLVIAGRDDFVFPPEHQAQIARGIPGARLRIIERAGHNPHDEQTEQVMAAIRSFIPRDGRVPPAEANVEPVTAATG